MGICQIKIVLFQIERDQGDLTKQNFFVFRIDGENSKRIGSSVDF